MARRFDDGRHERGRGMGFRRLSELHQKDGREILNIISNKQSGFSDLFDYEVLKPDWMRLVIAIIAKACHYAEQPLTGNTGISATSGRLDPSKGNSAMLMTLLNLIRTSKFLTQHVVSYTSGMLTETVPARRRSFPETIYQILVLCKIFLQVMPNNLQQVIPAVSTLAMVVNFMRANGTLPENAELEDMLKQVEEIQKNLIQKQSKQNEIRHSNKEIIEQVPAEPPDNFRELSIFPTSDDLHRREIFLRKNKIKGRYDNVEQYLDTHFRLLREDFMQPLRDGIKEYLSNNEKQDDKKRLTNVRIYQNVHILNPVCTADGVSYRIQFDAQRLHRVRWEVTKRLIYGALVCLSPDSFTTTYFATVSQRESKQLKKGMVELSFQHGTQEVTQIGAHQKLVMAESSAYFEAYRHVLQSLQIINQDTLPFAQYFVDCRKQINKPQYLIEAEVQGEQINYDLRPLFGERAGRRILAEAADPHQASDSEDSEVDMDLHSDHVDNSVDLVRDMPLYRRKDWPPANMMQLDESQLKALQNTLSREIALVQGPPGTGKTYIGLKIIRILLQNRHFWRIREEDTEVQKPILLICYTNHALDQFLEGISKFVNHGIVRVGGRSQSKILDRFMLRELRKGIRDRKDMPSDVHRARMDAMDEMDKLRSDVAKLVADLEASKLGLIHEDQLEAYIGDRQYSQIKRLKLPSRRNKDQKNSMFMTWLGLCDGQAIQLYDAMFNVAQATEVDEQEEVTFDSDDEIDGDVEEIEQQRIVHGIEDMEVREDQRRQKKLLDAALANLAITFADLESGDRHRKKQTKAKCEKDQEKITALLDVSDMMTEEEAQDLHDVSNIRLEHRWRLYRRWLNQYRGDIHEYLRELEDQYELAARRLKEVRYQEDLEVMRKATILGMTTTGAARYRPVLQQIQPNLVVVEEAAEVMEAHIVTALTPGCQQLILIGDHQQLRPNPTVYQLAETYKLKVSLFERLVINGLPYDSLNLQHRMRPDISALLTHIYTNLLDHPSVKDYDDIKGVSKNLFFIDHNHSESHNEDLNSKTNRHEATYIVALCRYLILQGYKPSQITILTPYTGQLSLIRRLMKAGDSYCREVRCTAIDNFQGEENDILLISLVRSNIERKIGFVADNNRACVTLSRAKKGMFLIGDASLLAQVSDLWSKVINTLRNKNFFGKALPLYCQNHPNIKDSCILASTAKDFDRAPEGGCELPCGKRLKCGHVCVRVCHAYDRAHEDYRCRKTCNRKICPQNHLCKKFCFEECGKCLIYTPRKMPQCHHIQHIPCYEHITDHKCTAQCKTILRCGHQCQNACGESHTVECTMEVKRTLLCGHTVKMKCSDKPSTFSCTVKCGTFLKCEHPCPGTCGSCFEGRLHVPCTSPCGRTLVCGHQCTAACTKDCPPCSEPCQNRCAHSICQEMCGVPCIPCIEPCAWQCDHHRCRKQCNEPCNRRRCEEPCEEELPCGHQCIGLCGEPCPNKCRVCHQEEVQEIMFGDEDEDDARFVQLEDCGHVIEVSALDRWIDASQDTTERDVTIDLKKCPKCNTTIRRNLRYGMIIKKILNDIEQVKKIVIQGGTEAGALRVLMQEKLNKLDDKILKQTMEKKFHRPADKLILPEEVACIQNTVNLLVNVSEIINHIKSKDDLKNIKSTLVDYCTLRRDCAKFKTWLLQDRSRFSEQELDEMDVEMMRIELLFRCLVCLFYMEQTSKILPPTMDARFSRTCKNLEARKPRRHPIEEKDTVKEIENLVPRSGLAVTDAEREGIVRALGLGKGHWFKCKNGHYYAIGDCGGATVESKCPECGTSIGGQSHTLRSDNAFAPEIDGATAPAWPTAMRHY